LEKDIKATTYLLNQFAKDCGLVKVGGKQKIGGLHSGTQWEIETEEKKRGVEEVIEKIEKQILQHTKEFNQCINYAVQNLRNNNPNEAARCLKESLRIESKIKDLFEQMKELEGDLRRLTKQDIKFLKREKKRFS